MANRFEPKSKKRNGQEPIPTGYSSGHKPDIAISPVGIEDVDIAMFNLFDKELPLQVGSTDGTSLKKVPVIFAGGEKWAQLKRNKPLRDKVNSLILPLITIGRSGIQQSTSEDIAGRGMNQRSGEFIIRRRLSSTDRQYQNLTNRLNLESQSNLALADKVDPSLMTLAPIGDLSTDADVRDGALLHPDRRRNIIETIVVPSPQFFTAMYEIIIWTQYTHHMNQLIETIMSSYLPQVQGWRLDTPKGYWFVAEVEEGSMSPETNFDDMTQGERLIKQKFNVKVPAYIFASNAPGVPVPVKRYLSAPKISFETGTAQNQSFYSNPSPAEPLVSNGVFLGADDPTLPLEHENVRRRDARRSGAGDLNFSEDMPDKADPAFSSFPRGRQLEKYAKVTSVDPAGKTTTKHVRIKNINKSTGETTYGSGFDLSDLSGVEVGE